MLTSIDFQAATVAGLPGVDDAEVLARAARDGRVLVTHDRKPIPRYFAEFVARETTPGLLVIPQHLPVASLCRAYACCSTLLPTAESGFKRALPFPTS